MEQSLHDRISELRLVEPEIPRYSADKPSRHGRIVWPMAQGYWATAAARAGNMGLFQREVETLAGLAKNSSWNFREIYHPATGEPDGGWQIRHPLGVVHAADLVGHRVSADDSLRLVRNDL